MSLSKTTDLFFVIKTQASDTLTCSGAEEKSQIMSYVQHNRRRREKREKPYSAAVSCTASMLSQSSSAPPARKKKAGGTASSTLRDLRENASAYPGIATQVYPANNSSDPFRCTVAGAMDAGLHFFLRYASSHGAKVTFLAEAFAPSTVVSRRASTRHRGIVTARMRRCVEDEALMFSTLAYSSSLLAWTTGANDHRLWSPEYFVGKALPAVRQRMAQQQERWREEGGGGGMAKVPDTGLLLSIYSLAITELWNCNPQLWTMCPERQAKLLRADRSVAYLASRAHLSALFSIVNAAGGWGAVDPYIMESTILADKCMAFQEMTAPMISADWAPDPFPESIRKLVGIGEVVGVSHAGSALLQGPICDDVKRLIREVFEYFHIAEFLWAREDVPEDVEQWLFLRLHALFHELLSLTNLVSIDNFVRLGILIALLLCTQHRGAQLAGKEVVKAVRKALCGGHSTTTTTPTTAASWNVAGDFADGLRFWLLYTAAMVDAESEDGMWCSGQLVAYYGKKLQLSTADILARELETYVFFPGRERQSLEALEKHLHRLLPTPNERTSECLVIRPI
ncbi:hypothetical protein BX600DRAFT_512502 [Xylariales sp. PMI_506]|nr:hypothetical protein BX600DRAFT_512502 [Xylariales sp. PMI_506]